MDATSLSSILCKSDNSHWFRIVTNSLAVTSGPIRVPLLDSSSVSCGVTCQLPARSPFWPTSSPVSTHIHSSSVPD